MAYSYHEFIKACILKGIDRTGYDVGIAFMLSPSDDLAAVLPELPEPA